jgi:hypothetical protein
MASRQLEPFGTTAFPFDIGGILAPEALVLWFFALALAYWIIYTIVAVYHWHTYAHNPAVAYPSVVLHLFVSLVLISYAASGAL